MNANLAKEFNTVFASPDIYRRLVEGVQAGIYVADAQGNIVYVNQAFVRILGYQSKEEVIGLNLPEQLYVNPQDRKEFLKQMEKLGFVKDYEVQNKRKNGTIATLSVTGNFIYGPGKDILGVEGVVHDITERKKLENDLSILRNAIWQSADHVMITDKGGVIQYVNPAFEKTTGFSKEEVLGKTPKILQSGRQSREYYKKLWDTILAGRVFHAHTTNKKKSGEIYIADQTVSPIVNEAGAVTHFVSIWKDITEKVKLEERLKIEKQKLEEIIGFDEKVSAIRKSDRLMDFVVSKTMKILEARQCGIVVADKEDGEFCVKASAGFGEEAGSVKSKIADLRIVEVVRNGNSIAESTFMCVPIKRDEDIVGAICVADKQTSFEETIFNDLDLKILCDIAREVAVAMENVKFYKELQYLTMTDPITNMHNFRHFAESLESEIKRLSRFPGHVSLLMIDIDNFKSYNDQFGHPAGDQLLRDIGKILKASVRDIDIVCRYAGDEFAVVLLGTDKTGAQVAAERIRCAIEQSGFEKPVTISIGAAEYKKDMTRYDLTSKADRALYEAKKNGKNKVCIFG